MVFLMSDEFWCLKEVHDVWWSVIAKYIVIYPMCLQWVCGVCSASAVFAVCLLYLMCVCGVCSVLLWCHCTGVKMNVSMSVSVWDLMLSVMTYQRSGVYVCEWLFNCAACNDCSKWCCHHGHEWCQQRLQSQGLSVKIVNRICKCNCMFQSVLVWSGTSCSDVLL